MAFDSSVFGVFSSSSFSCLVESVLQAASARLSCLEHKRSALRCVDFFRDDLADSPDMGDESPVCHACDTSAPRYAVSPLKSAQCATSVPFTPTESSNPNSHGGRQIGGQTTAVGTRTQVPHRCRRG